MTSLTMPSLKTILALAALVVAPSIASSIALANNGDSPRAAVTAPLGNAPVHGSR